MAYYAGLALQIIGFLLVGICLFTGLIQGDYSKMELAQFVLGTAAFYVGNFVRNRAMS